jgi:hypothetical protein
MWGTGSFAESSRKCRSKVAGLPVMVVRHQTDSGSYVTVLYATREIHEPLISAWSDRPEDAELVEAIAFSGRRSTSTSAP